MDWINKRTSDRDSVERLRDLYVELLLNVDIAREDLGTRRNEELQDCPASPKRSLLRRSLSRRSNGEGNSGSSGRKGLQETAFRVLSAIPALDKDNGDNGGAVAARDTATVLALSKAKSLESKVVAIVRAIGEVVADGDHQAGTSIRSDAVFEYFCEKNMLSLLVDIANAKPSDLRPDSGRIKLHEVAFSPRVKAQLLQTISILISNAQDAPSLYYLLSNNHVNDLIMGMLPLRQWTNHALEEMLPLYVELLRSVGVQLSASTGLVSFLTRHGDSNHHCFPLFYAAIEVVTSSYANSESFIHDKCLKLLVSWMQIPDPSIRTLISSSTAEHQKLSLHICQRLLDRYRRLSMLTTGPVVDPIRSNAIAGQLVTLQNEIESLNDVLWCGVKSLNVRACECLLQRIVSVLLRDLDSAHQRHLLAVGLEDMDVIPEREAIAQVSVLFLSQLFLRLEYPPFIRMLAVALLHPLSSTIWSKPLPKSESSIDDYTLTKSLNRIIVLASRDENVNVEDIVANPFRKELISCLAGDSGEWRFIPVAMLLESVLLSEALDLETLVSLEVIPKFPTDKTRYPESPFEEALAKFLQSREITMSAVSISALERAGSLAITLIPYLASSMTNCGKEAGLLNRFIHDSPLVKSLQESRSCFSQAALEFKDTSGVSQLFVDLIELAIKSRYLKLGENHSRHAVDYGCPLETFSCSQQTRNADILVRKFRIVGSNNVEDARFAIRMAIHYRALCLAVERMIEDCVESSPEPGASFAIDTIDRADDLLLVIGDLIEKPKPNTDLDLRGRMTFRFFPEVKYDDQELKAADSESNTRGRRLPKEIGRRSKNQLVLVLDATDIFIVKHINRSDVNRGTIICTVSLRSVIAFASDGDSLHVAVRNVEDVDTIIKNGNMALHFDNEGTCLIVRQYLERSRNILHSELGEKIQQLFSGNDEEIESSSGLRPTREQETMTTTTASATSTIETSRSSESNDHDATDANVVRV